MYTQVTNANYKNYKLLQDTRLQDYKDTRIQTSKTRRSRSKNYKLEATVQDLIFRTEIAAGECYSTTDDSNNVMMKK